MRIRKRLALCSSVPTQPPLTDLLRRSEVPPPSSQPSHPPKPPSDQTNRIRWAFSTYQDKMKQKEFGDDEGVNSNTDIRKIVSICHGEEGFNTNVHPSSSSLQQEEDYKVVPLPLKKRKGIFERNSKEEEESKSAKMKSKTNKKYGDAPIACDPKPAVEVEEEDGAQGMKNKKKKNKRGNVIMEGSRCSRVNGRGWRCCQPTLVGYSLCEHHLGKGRMRSVANVRRQHPPLTTTKKKKSKVGVVKARSMSSLLSQI